MRRASSPISSPIFSMPMKCQPWNIGTSTVAGSTQRRFTYPPRSGVTISRTRYSISAISQSTNNAPTSAIEAELLTSVLTTTMPITSQAMPATSIG